MNIMRGIHSLASNHLLLITFALVCGLTLSPVLSAAAPFSVWILAAIFFFSSLHIAFEDALRVMTRPGLLLMVNGFMLLLFPFCVWWLTNLFLPSLSIPLLLLSAMPAGMTAPLLTKIAHGNDDMALVFTVTTSLLAPFTVPLVLLLTVGNTVPLSFRDMFLTLATVIFIPFVLAQIAKKMDVDRVRRGEAWHHSVSSLLLALLIASIVATKSQTILLGFWSGQTWMYIVLLTCFFVGLHVIGYGIAWRSPHQNRIAITVCLTYMNFTLAIVLAEEYFSAPHIVIPTVLSVIPWALLLPLFRKVSQLRTVPY